MNNLLIETLIRSFESKKNEVYQPAFHPPFLTISREFGCQANLLSGLINEEIHKRGHDWQIVNKEILNNAGQELKIHPDKVDQVISEVNRGMLDEALDAISAKYYKSDRKIRKTVADVVTTFANEGNVIIIGRGGASITRDMANGLHIRLAAPSSWRMQSIMDRQQLSREDALTQITTMDHKRFKLQRDYMKGITDFDALFDLKFNCSKVSFEEITQIIIHLMESRKMI